MDFESQPSSGSFGSVGYMWHCPPKYYTLDPLLNFFFPFPLWIPLPQPTTTVWVALISVSDHVLVRTDNLLGWTYLHSTFLYVNDSTITTQPISPLIFGLSNSITSQVFFSGYSLDIWLCFSQTRSSTLLHLCLYGLCLQSFLLVIFSSKNPSYKIRLPPSPVQETESGPLPLLPVFQIHPFHFILIIHMLPELGLLWPGPQQQLPSWSRFLDLFFCVPFKSCWTMLVWIHSDSSRKSSIPLLVSPTPFHKHWVWLLFVPHCGRSSTQSVVFSSLLINTFCYEHLGWYCEFQIPSPYSWVHRKDTVYS